MPTYIRGGDDLEDELRRMKNMKYISNVLKTKEAKNLIYKNSGAYVAISLAYGINALGAFLLTPLLSTSLVFNEIVGAIIASIISFVIYNVAILRIEEKIKEFRNQLDNNLVKYFRINGSVKKKNSQLKNFELFEHINGLPFIMIQILAGSHKYEPSYNWRFYTDLLELFARYGVEFLMYTTNEDYSNSIIWSYLNKELDRIDSDGENDEFRLYMNSIFKNLAEKSERVEIPTVFIKINLTSLSSRVHIEQLVDDIVILHKKSSNNVRDIRFLNRTQLYRFLIKYHKLDIIDLNASKARSKSKINIGKSKLIRIVRFNGKEELNNIHVINEKYIDRKIVKKKKTVKRVIDIN